MMASISRRPWPRPVCSLSTVTAYSANDAVLPRPGRAVRRWRVDQHERHFAVIVDLCQPGGQLPIQRPYRRKKTEPYIFRRQLLEQGLDKRLILRPDRPQQQRAAIGILNRLFQKLRIGSDCEARVSRNPLFR